MSNPDLTRFAIIADIHGNGDALNVVLEDIDRLEIGVNAATLNRPRSIRTNL